MPALSDVANVMHLSTIEDWKFISNWYNDLATAKAIPNYEVKEAVKSLLGADKNLTQLQIAEKIYDYITKNVTYSSVSFRQSGLVPQKPSDVINTRIGDCKDVSTLFVSMAKEAGLEAQLVLVNTSDNGIKSMMLPSINFNHCMVKVKADGKDYYLELTSNFLPFSTFDLNSINSLILDIDNKSDQKNLMLLDPTTRKRNIMDRTVKIKAQNADLIINDQTYSVASPSAHTRNKFSELSEKDKLKQIQEIIRSSSPTAEVTKVSFKNLQNSGNRDTVYTNIDYKIKDDIKTIGGLTIITLPWTGKALSSDFNIISPRVFPLDLTQVYSLDKNKEVIHFTIPEGKTFVENLGPVSLSNEYINFSLSVKQTGKIVSYTRLFEQKKGRVPSEQVLEFEAFYKKIVAADNKQIALK